MMTAMTSECFAFDSPATYQICVHGAIAVEWADRLQGLVIRVIASEGGSPTTLLTGELLDQAALMGVLNTLYNLHLTLLLVNRLGEANEAGAREFDPRRAG